MTEGCELWNFRARSDQITSQLLIKSKHTKAHYTQQSQSLRQHASNRSHTQLSPDQLRTARSSRPHPYHHRRILISQPSQQWISSKVRSPQPTPPVPSHPSSLLTLFRNPRQLRSRLCAPHPPHPSPSRALHTPSTQFLLLFPRLHPPSRSPLPQYSRLPRALLPCHRLGRRAPPLPRYRDTNPSLFQTGHDVWG